MIVKNYIQLSSKSDIMDMESLRDVKKYKVSKEELKKYNVYLKNS